MGIFSDLLGTIRSTFDIGLLGIAGTRTLRFRNAFTGSLQWTPTGNRTVTIPDSTGTIALRDAPQSFTGRQSSSIVSADISGSVTIDLSQSNFFVYTLTGDVTNLTASNIVAGTTYIIYLIEDATGGRTLAFDAGVFQFVDDAPTAITTTANKINIITAVARTTTSLDCWMSKT